MAQITIDIPNSAVPHLVAARDEINLQRSDLPPLSNEQAALWMIENAARRLLRNRRQRLAADQEGDEDRQIEDDFGVL